MSGIFSQASRRAFSRRFTGGNTLVSPSYLLSRRMAWTGSRYQGYVSYYNDENLFGFVVRDDMPEREYYFHSSDILSDSIARTRPLQRVSFTITESTKNNQFLARDLASPDGSPLIFNHPNIRLRAEERTRRLSELPDYDTMRHTGIVVSVHTDGNGGLIVPDRLNFDTVSYRNHEIQSTGATRLDRFSEVEFFVRRSRFRDIATCVTRVGGQLITAERREVGQIRRALGAMYTMSDKKARVPADFKGDRRLGYVRQFDSDKLFGWIVPFDFKEGDDMVFVHLDDCHMCGKRALKRFQTVEYSLVTDKESGRAKAMHVSGPNETILRFVSDNHYVPYDLLTERCQVSEDNSVRYVGEVIRVKQDRQFCLIKPVKQGLEEVIAFNNDFEVIGRTLPSVGDLVEFSVVSERKKPDNDSDEYEDESAPAADADEDEDENEKRKILIAQNITMPGGKPFVFLSGEYGNYLRDRVDCPTEQQDLDQVAIPADPSTRLVGFISQYSRNARKGMIEPMAPSGQRYRKVKFELGDCNVNSTLLNEMDEIRYNEEGRPTAQDGDRLLNIPGGIKVEFNVEVSEPVSEKDFVTRVAKNVSGLDGTEIPAKITVVGEKAMRANRMRDQDESQQQQSQQQRSVLGFQSGSQRGRSPGRAGGFAQPQRGRGRGGSQQNEAEKEEDPWKYM